MRMPSPAMIVALLGVFLGLGGVGVAATGGNFILGQPNSADKTTALSSGVTTGPTLELTNGGNRPAARFNTAGGVQPFIVTNPTKVSNLNVDRLDGLSSESFTQGGGRLYSAHREGVSPGSLGTLMDIPGVITIKYECASGAWDLSLRPSNLHAALYTGGSSDTIYLPPQSIWDVTGTQTKSWHLLGSRAFNRQTFEPAVFVNVQGSGIWTGSTCVFQAVAEVFG